MVPTNGAPDSFELHQREVCNAFARAAAAMRDAANTAESFSNWFARANNMNNLDKLPVPPFSFDSRHRDADADAETSSSRKRNSPDGEGEIKGKRKRAPKEKKEKKTKDKNAPKKPPSAYFLFQNDVRADVKAQHPGKINQEIMQEMSKIWRALKPDEKAPYLALQAQHKEQFKKNMILYEAKKEAGGAEVTNAETKVDAEQVKSKTSDEVSLSSHEGTPKATAASDEEDEDSVITPSTVEKASDDEDEDEGSASESESELEEPPRKQSKKEPAKVPTPPPAKTEKKKKGTVVDAKKKKKKQP